VVGQVRVAGDAKLAGESGEGVSLTVEKSSGRAVVTFDYEKGALDLSAFRDIAIPVKNGTGSELDILLSATSDRQKGWLHGTDGRYFVRAGEELDLTTLMARRALPSDHPHVKRLGNLFAFPWGHQRNWRAVDAASILQASVRMDWRNAEVGQIIEISYPRGAGSYSTDPAVLESLDLPLMDTFGQLRDRDWPGKISNAEELREDGRKAMAFVGAVTKPGEGRSRFGGFMGGPELKATGFFRVEKIDGKWWFVDPDGKLFWSLGINCTGGGSDTRVEGREDLFPESQRGQPEIRYYDENLKIKFGEDGWREKHVDLTVSRMFDWGLNTVGAWSMEDFVETQRIPYTLIVHTDMQPLGSVKKIPDPWSKAFKNSLDKRLSDFAASHADSPWLVGVFIDNELEWQGGNELVQEIIKSRPGTPARAALVGFLRERYGDVAALNKAWGTSFKSLAAIQAKPGQLGDKAYQKDLNDFLAVFANEYFAQCRAAMDKYFPNHLYLGCRFNSLNPIVTTAASRVCDVISVNIYQHSFDGFTMKTETDRPWVISEFHFGIRDYGNLGVGLTWAADARNQADVVQGYLSDALRHPNFVGAHWFQWSDQAVTGRKDGENFGVGLVTIVDRPVETLTDAMREVSGELYDYRLGSPEGRIGEGAKLPPASPDETGKIQTP
jgi:hypothetical protein